MTKKVYIYMINMDNLTQYQVKQGFYCLKQILKHLIYILAHLCNIKIEYKCTICTIKMYNINVLHVQHKCTLHVQ